MNNTTWPFPHPAPGVYFNMPFDEYLAIPALSSSAIKLLLVAGPNFWQDSWFNPHRLPRDTKAFADGRAYHKRILEGPAAFYAAYAPTFVCPDDEDILRDNAAMVEALQRIGVAANKGDNAATLAAKLAYHHPAARTAYGMERDHIARHPGKEFIHPDTIFALEMGNRAIECNPHINHWVLGGYPEVTVIFFYNGLLFKCRFDYLKIGSCTDLKTVANEARRAFPAAVNYAIAGNQYLIQPALYLHGYAAAQVAIAQGRVYGAEGVPAAWLEAAARTDIEEFRFIFHQKGLALVTEGRIYSVRNQRLMSYGQAKLEHGCDVYKDYYGRYGADLPWISGNAPEHIDMDSLPGFMRDL